MRAAPIELDNVTLGYDRHPAVHHLSGSFAPGSLTAVVGPNGAGKSTLLKAMAGLLSPLSGQIRHGAPARDSIAYLPQTTDIDRGFPITVTDFVAAGLWRRTGAFGGFGRGERARCAEAMRTVGLDGFEKRPIGALSGGQLQRVLFARLILQDRPIVLLDEPFTSLDAATLEDLLALLLRWHAEGRTVIAVMHDFALVRARFPDTLLLAREAVAWGPTATVLGTANLSAARQMMESFDLHAPICRREAA